MLMIFSYLVETWTSQPNDGTTLIIHLLHVLSASILQLGIITLPCGQLFLVAHLVSVLPISSGSMNLAHVVIEICSLEAHITVIIHNQQAHLMRVQYPSQHAQLILRDCQFTTLHFSMVVLLTFGITSLMGLLKVRFSSSITTGSAV